MAERVNGILKEELLQTTYSSFEEAKKAWQRQLPFIILLGHIVVAICLQQMKHIKKEGELKKHWKNYYKKKEVEMAVT